MMCLKPRIIYEKDESVIRLNDHIMPEHEAYLAKYAIVSFAITQKTEADGKSRIYSHPLIMNARGGCYVTYLENDEEVLEIVPAAPGNYKVDLKIKGPAIKQDIGLGVQYSDSTPVDWEASAIHVLDHINASYDEFKKAIENDDVEGFLRKQIIDTIDENERVDIPDEVKDAIDDMVSQLSKKVFKK